MNSLLVEPNGSIVVCGQMIEPSSIVLALRLDSSGSLMRGLLTVTELQVDNRINCAMAQPGGKLLLGGTVLVAELGLAVPREPDPIER